MHALNLFIFFGGKEQRSYQELTLKINKKMIKELLRSQEETPPADGEEKKEEETKEEEQQ